MDNISAQLEQNSKRDDLLFSWDGFEALDATKQFAFFKASLEAMDAQVCNQLIQAKLVDNLQLKPGDKILEAGCGLGRRAKLLAKAAGQKVIVTAIDKSEKVLEVAKKSANAENLTYQVADVEALPFPNDYFDIVTADRLLICFDNPITALKEMYRVLKPNGKLIVTDFDPLSILITPIDKTLSEIFTAIYMPSFNNRFIGRELPSLFNQIGIENFTVEADASYERSFSQLEKIIPMKAVLEGGVRAGYLTNTVAEKWLADLRQACANKTFLYSISMISVLGIK